MKKQIILFISSSSLISCGLLGPDYSKPVISTPTTWNSQSSQVQISDNDLTQLMWWKKFNDPCLNQLIESALINNNSIQSAMGNVLQAQASLKSIQMGWVPDVGVGATGSLGQLLNPSITAKHGSTIANDLLNNPQNFNAYTAGFVPVYTLNVFSQLKQVEIGKLSLFAQQQVVYSLQLSVISQVAASYFSLLGFTKQLQLQQQLLADAIEMRKYNEMQYKNGSTSSINVVDIDQFIANIKSTIPVTQHNIIKSSNALQVLTDNNPGKIITNNNFDNIDANEIVFANLPSQVLKNRPDVAMAESQLKINNADIGLVTSQFFPTLNLTGMGGAASVEFNNLFTSQFWISQLSAASPIFDLSLYADIDKAKGGYYAAYYNYIGTVRSAFEDVDDSLSKHDTLTQMSEQQTVALGKSKELYQLTYKQFNYGSVSYLNTVYRKIGIDESLLSFNNVKLHQVNSIVTLYQALGGGYNGESQLTKVKRFEDDKHDI